MTSADIRAVLESHKVLPEGEELSIDLVHPDTLRERKFDREAYQISVGGRARLQLFVGPSLQEIHLRCVGFHAACPSITVGPVFFLREGGLDFLGLEFAEGITLEAAHALGKLPRSLYLSYITALDAALELAAQPSSPRAAEAELNGLIQKLISLPVLSNGDQAWLTSFIAPRLKPALLGGATKLRWTNGDFIAQNIVLTPSGPKIVDYEFALQTHFYFEDYSRLARYSPSLPADVLDWCAGRLGSLSQAAEIFGLLRQIVLEYESKTLPGFQVELDLIKRELIPRLERWRAEGTQSVFLPPALSEPAEAGAVEAAFQAFYSHDLLFEESRAVAVQVREASWTRVEVPIPIAEGAWRIRVDPIHRPGVVEISSVQVRQSGRTARDIPFDSLIVGGTAIATALTPSLMIVGYGLDPQMILPEVAIEGSGPVWIVVWMRWERLDTGLGAILERLSAGHFALPPVVREIRELTNTLDRMRDRLRASETQASAAEVRLDEAEAELESARSELALIEERQRNYDQGAIRFLAQVRELRQSLAAAEKAGGQNRDAIEDLNRQMAIERQLRLEAEAERGRLLNDSAQMAATVARQRNDLGEREQRLQTREDHERHLREGLEALKRRVADLEASLSWRITSPLRRSLDALKSITGSGKP